jgi:hypothetical protein
MRVRNFLIDNTTGTIYTNVVNTTTATKDKIAAGSSPKFLKTTISGSGKPTVIVRGNKPIIFGREVLINNISLSVADRRGRATLDASPRGGSDTGITVRVRKVTNCIFVHPKVLD